MMKFKPKGKDEKSIKKNSKGVKIRQERSIMGTPVILPESTYRVR